MLNLSCFLNLYKLTAVKHYTRFVEVEFDLLTPRERALKEIQTEVTRTLSGNFR